MNIDWTVDAACIGMEDDIFFENAYVKEAKAICMDCPVRLLCLEAELKHPTSNYGVFGGATPNERGLIRQNRLGRDLKQAAGTKRVKGRGCSVEDCARPHKGRGFCQNHLTRALRRGDIEPKGGGRKCSIPGCERPHVAKGWCNSHYTQYRWKAGSSENNGA